MSQSLPNFVTDVSCCSIDNCNKIVQLPPVVPTNFPVTLAMTMPVTVDQINPYLQGLIKEQLCATVGLTKNQSNFVSLVLTSQSRRAGSTSIAATMYMQSKDQAVAAVASLTQANINKAFQDASLPAVTMSQSPSYSLGSSLQPKFWVTWITLQSAVMLHYLFKTP